MLRKIINILRDQLRDRRPRDDNGNTFKVRADDTAELYGPDRSKPIRKFLNSLLTNTDRRPVFSRYRLRRGSYLWGFVLYGTWGGSPLILNGLGVWSDKQAVLVLFSIPVFWTIRLIISGLINLYFWFTKYLFTKPGRGWLKCNGCGAKFDPPGRKVDPPDDYLETLNPGINLDEWLDTIEGNTPQFYSKYCSCGDPLV